MTLEWKPIETLPPEFKDGRPVMVKRVHERRIIAQGLASWRTVRFPEIFDSTLSRKYAEAYEATGWMRHEADKRFPEPTHWANTRHSVANTPTGGSDRT